MKFLPRQHVPVFPQNRSGDANRVSAPKAKRYRRCFEAIRFPAGGHQHVRIENCLQTVESGTIVRIG